SRSFLFSAQLGSRARVSIGLTDSDAWAQFVRRSRVRDATISRRLMIGPQFFHFSQIDQELLSTGTAARLLTSSLLGGVIGFEREWRHKASGLRTNMLLCMGCAF